MKWCLNHEILCCVYAHLVLEVWLCDLDKLFHISYLYIENVYSLNFPQSPSKALSEQKPFILDLWQSA